MRLLKQHVVLTDRFICYPVHYAARVASEKSTHVSAALKPQPLAHIPTHCWPAAPTCLAASGPRHSRLCYRRLCRRRLCRRRLCCRTIRPAIHLRIRLLRLCPRPRPRRRAPATVLISGAGHPNHGLLAALVVELTNLPPNTVLISGDHRPKPLESTSIGVGLGCCAPQPHPNRRGLAALAPGVCSNSCSGDSANQWSWAP